MSGPCFLFSVTSVVVVTCELLLLTGRKLEECSTEKGHCKMELRYDVLPKFRNQTGMNLLNI